MTQNTISIVGSYRLGRKQRQALFQGLQDFARLSDYYKDLEVFRVKHPRFYPLTMYEAHGGPLPCWHPGIVYSWRDMLRRVWRGDEHADDLLPRLLGLRPYVPEMSLEEAEYLDKEELDSPPAPALSREFSSEAYKAEIVARVGKSGQPLSGVTLGLATFIPSWRRGEFRYIHKTDFQLAVCLLFLESWRARICGVCDDPFVADKARQRYCSVKCSHAASLQRQKRWWGKHGKAWQASRRKSQSRGKKR